MSSVAIYRTIKLGTEVAVQTVSWEEYTRSIHLFLAGLGKGVDVDFSKRKLVGIGHSMGAIALYVLPLSSYSQQFYSSIFDPISFTECSSIHTCPP